LATCQRPFHGSPPITMEADLVALHQAGRRPIDFIPWPADMPPQLLALIQQCWSSDAANRPTVVNVRRALTSALADAARQAEAARNNDVSRFIVGQAVADAAAQEELSVTEAEMVARQSRLDAAEARLVDVSASLDQVNGEL
jgi:hypothetical protein